MIKHNMVFRDGRMKCNRCSYEPRFGEHSDYCEVVYEYPKEKEMKPTEETIKEWRESEEEEGVALLRLLRNKQYKQISSKLKKEREFNQYLKDKRNLEITKRDELIREAINIFTVDIYTMKFLDSYGLWLEKAQKILGKGK